MIKRLICLLTALLIAFSSVNIMAEEAVQVEGDVARAQEEINYTKAVDFAIGLGAFEEYNSSALMSIDMMVKAMGVLTQSEAPIREYLGENGQAPVKRITALAIALDVLGYSIVFDDGTINENDEAEIQNVASRYDISDGISSDIQGTITMKETAELIYNVLNAKTFLITYSENGIRTATLSDNIFMNSAMHISEIRGVVKATSYSSLIDTSGTLCDEIIIDDKNYNCTQGAFEELIGRRVDALVKTVNGAEYLVAVHDLSTGKDVLEINADDLDLNRIAKNGITFWSKNGKKETITLSPMVDVLYNNTLLKDFTEDDFKITQGSIILINNNKDADYDVVLIKVHESFITYGVSANTGKISDLYGKTYNINDLMEYGYPLLLNGKQIEIQNIEAYAVATCYVNKNGQVIALYLGNEIAGGILNNFDEAENTVTIEGKKYKYTNEIKAKLKAVASGTNLTVYLNMFGEIAHFEISDDAYLYGYLTNFSPAELFTGPRLRVFTQTNEFKVYEAKSTIKYNGIKLNSDDVFGKKMKNELWDGKNVKPQLVKYRANAKGEILSLYAVSETEVNDPDRLVLNRSGMFCFFNGPMTICPNVRLRTTTKVFKIPLDPMADEGYEYGTYSILIDDGAGRQTYVYDVDENAYANAVVMNWDHESLDVTMDQLSTPVYQVEESGEFLNNKGELSVFVVARELGDNSTLHEFRFAKPEVFVITPGQLPDIGQYNAKHLTRGDIIQVTENSNREYAALAIRFKIDGNMPYYEIMKGMAPYIVQSQDRYYGSNNSHSYGVVKEVFEDGYLVNNQMGNLQNDPSWDRVITTKHYTSVWICENNGEDIYEGSVADLKKGDKIYSFLVGLAPKEIIIFR